MTEKMISGVIAVAAVAVVGAAGYVGRKLTKLTKKIGMSMDELTDATKQDIQDSLIEGAVQKAANHEVSRYAREAASEALRSVRGEVKVQVKKTVEDTFTDLEKAVKDEVTAQVAAIDHKALQKDVTEEAKKKILEKFDGNLDDLLKDFSDNLDRVKKIYTSISDTLSERKSCTGRTIHID